MKAALALITCPLVALAASAKPDVNVPGPFVAVVWGPEDGGVPSGSPINASGGKFYGNKETATYCPDGVSGLDCSQFSGTDTVFVIGEGPSSLGLDVTVPGGQQVYVAPDGSLSFTQAHSAYIPPGSIIDGFFRDDDLYLLDHSFYLCSTPDSFYQVFAFTTPLPGCERIEIRTSAPPEEHVWQYT